MLSKNAQTARLGFKAEEVLTTLPAVAAAFATYFTKPVKAVVKAPHGKKTDVIVQFTDGTNTRIQNKNGNNQRGFSVDRRDGADLTTSETCRSLIDTVCLKRGGPAAHRPSVSSITSLQMVDTCFLGDDTDWAPDYITHTQMKDGTLQHMAICSMPEFVKALKAEIYAEVVPKRTCVHLSPSIYLQRKGGGKTDKKPDQIQTKWKQGASVEKLFTPLF